LILALLIALPFPVTGTVRLPDGATEISSEIRLPDGAHDLTIVGGDHSTLRASDKFHGRAIFSCRGCRQISFRNFAIDGNRQALEKPMPLPPTDKSFASFFTNNGILIEATDGLSVDHLDFRNIPSFAILVNHSNNILLDHMSVKDSGSLNAKGRNNTTGGILLEEGVNQFTVADSVFGNIRGNGVWTHSRYRSPRNIGGKIAKNTFFDIGRDAIQVGHATGVHVMGNYGSRIGFPPDLVDVENAGTPVGMDTAGNVDQSIYEYNNFEEIDGKCIDLDGFHDGTVRGNTCINRRPPEDYPYGNFGISINNTSIEMHSKNIVIEDNQLTGMKFGGIFALGEGHMIRNNRMTNLNTAHCNETHARFGCLAILGEPGFLESGIYLAKGGEHPAPARNITIENNVISGYKMAAHCIESAPSVKLSDNILRNNTCTNE
jgi:Right handed beta helix region